MSRSKPPGEGNAGARSARHLSRQLAVYSSVGVLAAAILLVAVNILAWRHPMRWDATSSGLFTLSEPTLETLNGLSEPVDIFVFLARSDPQMGATRGLLEQYRASCSRLSIHYVDPERQPARFVALQRKYRLGEGRAERGQLVSDAALLVVSGAERWVIGPEEVTRYDAERATLQPVLEQALTEGIRQVLHPEPTVVCFDSGHGEASAQDGGPQGLAELGQMLSTNNYEQRTVNVAAASSALSLSSCNLLVLAAPSRLVTAQAVGRIVAEAQRGLNILVATSPLLDDSGRVQPSGLDPLLGSFGIGFGREIILEGDTDRRLPVGIGEVFLVNPVAHEVTAGMVAGEQPRHRAVVQLAQSVSARPGAEDAHGLLQTSAQAFSLRDPRKLAEVTAIDQIEPTATGPFFVAMASSLPMSRSKTRPRPARLVAIGSAAPLATATLRDPALVGNRRFVESAVSWLVSRPALIRLPDKPGRKTAMRLTEGAMGEVGRYVLFYMPVTALLLGGLLLFRRRYVGATDGVSAARSGGGGA